MTEQDIKALAKVRGQIVVYVVIHNKPRWLLTDKKNQKSTLSTLLESMSTDDWVDFQDGKLEVFDGLFRPMHPDKIYNWKSPATQNIFIRRKLITEELIKQIAKTIVDVLYDNAKEIKYHKPTVLRILKGCLNGKPIRL